MKWPQFSQILMRGSVESRTGLRVLGESLILSDCLKFRVFRGFRFLSGFIRSELRFRAQKKPGSSRGRAGLFGKNYLDEVIGAGAGADVADGQHEAARAETAAAAMRNLTVFMFCLSVVGWFCRQRLARTGAQELAVWKDESSAYCAGFEQGDQTRNFSTANGREGRVF